MHYKHILKYLILIFIFGIINSQEKLSTDELLAKFNHERNIGNYEKACHPQVDGQGIRMICDRALMSCADRPLNFLDVTKDDLQFVLFHHVNEKGTRVVSFASMKSVDQSMLTERAKKEKLTFDPFPDVYMANHLVNNINDLDVYRKNVDLVDISLQNMGDGKNSLFCMQGSLFEGNSLIKGVKVFNWKL